MGKRASLRRRLRAWARALALPVACAFALPASAPAASARSGWDPPRELSGARSAPLSLAAAAGVDGSGSGVVLWHSGAGVQAVIRSAGHGFGAARPIRGSKLSMPDLRPRLAFDPRGAALAVWSYFEPHPRFVEDGYSVDYTFGLRVAARAARGGFGRAQTLTDRLDADPSADIAIDPAGTAVVVWTDEAGIHAAARPAGKRRFQHAQVISQTQADPQVSASSRGAATAAWTAKRGGEWSVRAASAEDGDGFGRVASLPIEGLGDAKPVLGVDGRAAVTAAWERSGRVMAATCSAKGHCGRAHALSPAGETAVDPRVAVAADGTAVVAWRSDRGVAASVRRGHGSFRDAVALASLDDGERATGLAVGIGPRGDAAAVWTLHGESGDRVVAAVRRGKGRFARAHDLTADVPGAAWSDPQVVLGGDGGALAVWGALIDGRPSIQATAYAGAAR
jgi:hypothetical protein